MSLLKISSVTPVSSVLKSFLAALLCACCLENASAHETTTALTHVTVIDGRSSQRRIDQTVLVRRNRLGAVGPAAIPSVPAGARVIEGRGKCLTRGLWEMHVHTSMPGGRDVLELYIANGVTGVRDMAGDWPTIT